MDFPLERPGLFEGDLDKVYRYTQRATTVFRFLDRDPVSSFPDSDEPVCFSKVLTPKH